MIAVIQLAVFCQEAGLDSLGQYLILFESAGWNDTASSCIFPEVWVTLSRDLMIIDKNVTSLIEH